MFTTRTERWSRLGIGRTRARFYAIIFRVYAVIFSILIIAFLTGFPLLLLPAPPNPVVGAYDLRTSGTKIDNTKPWNEQGEGRDCEMKSASIGGEKGLLCTKLFREESDREMWTAFGKQLDLYRKQRDSVSIEGFKAEQRAYLKERDEQCEYVRDQQRDPVEKQIWYNQCIQAEDSTRAEAIRRK